MLLLLSSGILKQSLLVLLNKCVALIKDLLTVFLAHELSELGEFAGADIHHFILVSIACHVAVLALVDDGGALGALGLGSGERRINIVGIWQV